MEPIGGGSSKVVAAWDSFKRYFAPRVDGVSSGGESGDSDSETPETPNSKREYFEKSNSLFSGVNNPFSSGPSSSSYNKVSTNVEESGAAQRLSSSGYQQNRSSSISTFHDYNQQNNEYDEDREGDSSGWKGFGGNDDKSNSRSSDDWGAGWSGDSPSPKKQTTTAADVKKVSKKPKKASTAASNDDNPLIDFGEASSSSAVAASKKADDDGWGSLEDDAWESLNN